MLFRFVAFLTSVITKNVSVNTLMPSKVHQGTHNNFEICIFVIISHLFTDDCAEYVIFLAEWRNRSVGIATGYGLDSWGSIPVLWSIHPPIQWLLGTLSLAVNGPEREVGHSPPSSAEVNNGEDISPLSHGVVINLAQEQIYIYLYLGNVTCSSKLLSIYIVFTC
jgi:hypothetical protein